MLQPSHLKARTSTCRQKVFAHGVLEGLLLVALHVVPLAVRAVQDLGAVLIVAVVRLVVQPVGEVDWTAVGPDEGSLGDFVIGTKEDSLPVGQGGGKSLNVIVMVNQVIK